MSKGAIEAAVRLCVMEAVKAEGGEATGCNNNGLDADAASVALSRWAANGDNAAAPLARLGDDMVGTASCGPACSHIPQRQK
jgi:hypothetical protein